MSPRGERFFRAAWRVSMPLWLWAAHFFVGYAMVAAACLRDLSGETTRLVLALLTVLVAGWLAALLPRRAARARHRVHSRSVERWRRAAAALALVAVIWSALPLTALNAC